MIDKVNAASWQEFNIDELFDIKKGERLIENGRINGEIPLITASSYNNGITSYIDSDIFKESKKEFTNQVTVDMFCNTFFHGYTYFSDDNIHTLLHKGNIELNIYNGLFLVSILKKIQSRYGFGRQVRLHRLKKEIIKLPAIKNSKGKYEPDWQFMECYIKSILHKVDFSNTIANIDNIKKSNSKIDDANWQEFLYDDIFEIERGKRLTKLNQISGEIAYASSTKDNNGIDNYITPPEYMTCYSNALTLNNSGSVGYCFYHPYDFVASDHCTILLLKDRKVNLNTNIALFLISIIEKLKPRYSFGREVNNNRLKKEIIKLPSKQNKNGEYEPDWQFMEDYIKSLPYSSNL